MDAKDVRTHMEAFDRKVEENVLERREQRENTSAAPADKPAERKETTEKTPGKNGVINSLLSLSMVKGAGEAWEGVKNSFKNLKNGFTMENLGNAMQKASDFFSNFFEKLRPRFAWVASIPGLGFLIGKENVRKVKEFFGIDEKTEKLIGEIAKRMPEGMVFAGAGSEDKAITRLEDLRKKVRTLSGKKEEEYSTVDLFNDLKDGGLLAKHAEDKGGKKALTFEGLAKAAEEFAQLKKKETEEKAKQAAPAVAAAAPAAAPSTAPAPAGTAPSGSAPGNPAEKKPS